MDLVQPEFNMLYFHGPFDSATIRALFYNTKWWDNYFKYIVLQPSHEIGEELRISLNKFKEDFFKENNFIHSQEFEKIEEEGYHIIPSNINGLNDRIYNTLIKYPNNKYFVFDSANLEPLNTLDSVDKIKDHKNCIFYTTIRIIEENKRFDFGFILRKFIANRIVLQHYLCSDLFKNTKKKYRLDLSIRNFPQKDERVELLKVLQNHQKENINLRVNDYYVNRMEQLYLFAKEHDNKDKLQQYGIEFRMLERIKKNLAVTTPLVAGMQEHIGAMKLLDVTLSSDIQIMFESNQNSLYRTDEKQWCNITEKTIDNLLIGKPFIICSKVAYDFLQHFGFEIYDDVLQIDYDDIFKNYDLIVKKLSKHIIRISELNDTEYKLLNDKLLDKAEINRLKCLELIKENNILDNIINDYNLNFKI